jgi:hypothetical protein
MKRASREGALANRTNDRLSFRAGYAASSATRCLDRRQFDPEHLGDGLQMWLNLGLSGMGFCEGYRGLPR